MSQPDGPAISRGAIDLAFTAGQVVHRLITDTATKRVLQDGGDVVTCDDVGSAIAALDGETLIGIIRSELGISVNGKIEEAHGSAVPRPKSIGVLRSRVDRASR